jgi:hypothetical protein
MIIKGSLAQLGERLICIQEVSGSIPLGSTNSSFKVSFEVLNEELVPRFLYIVNKFEKTSLDAANKYIRIFTCI